jgi:two-component system, OmpR family, response regulator BaeR
VNGSILIVEDESDLAAIVADYVSAAGYAVQVLADGREALASVRRAAPELIVLDIMLPGLDGIALCHAVREFSDVPIIMVTARVQEIDRLLGLETGADDYVCKPFSPRELVARIKAVLRRRLPPAPAAGEPLFQVNEAARRIRLGGDVLELTPSEYGLLAALLRRPGTVFSRAQLLDLARGEAPEVADRAIDSHIKNLRRKLADRAPGVDWIRSVYGIGYRLEL